MPFRMYSFPLLPTLACDPELQRHLRHAFVDDIGYIKDASGEPVMPPGMRQLLKDDLDKGFDF